MISEDIAQRVAVLEDVEAIKRLKAEYASHCDDGYNFGDLGRLFTQDAIWDGGSRGRYEGREAIEAWFESARELHSFALHLVINPIIDIKDDDATARWYLFMAGTVKSSGQAIWNAAKYRDSLHRTEEGWKFTNMTLEHQFTTPYELGWSLKPFLF